MRKVFGLAFALVASVSLVSFYAAAQTAESGNFELDKEKAEDFQLKETLQNAESSNIPVAETEETKTTDETKPQIIREDIENGYIEKILSPEGQVIAEKTIQNDKVVKNVLNYYSPEGLLIRQVTVHDGDNNFYAEEFYPNGNVSSSAAFINESNKIGKERKYDYKGILRQEVTWMLPKQEADKPTQELKTVRYGTIITYYPSGAKAAEFSVGKPGNNIFYDESGNIIKEIADSEILNFSKELTLQDCSDKAVQLSLEELVELYEDEGDISYNKCGLPYREIFVYEVVSTSGNQSTKISYDETGQIRRITPYQNGVKEGVLQKFDAAGNLSAEITYHNGRKHGEAVGYFPTGNQAFHKEYAAGKAIDTLTCYFPDGAIAAEFHYENGLKEGTARINSPVSRELEFSKGELLNQPEPANERRLVSHLQNLGVVDERCLNIDDKRLEVLAAIDAGINEIENGFRIDEAENCQDLNAFKEENGAYTCYDGNNILRARYTAENGTDDYVNVEIYTTDGAHRYNIPYYSHQRQGWAQKLDDSGNITAEMYYYQGKPAEEARSYYENGTVKSMLSTADEQGRKILTGYDRNGALKFSTSYKDGKKNQVFMTKPEKNKDIYIRFYKGELDNVRETNTGKPANYIEYNFALGEYTVSRDNELIRGGHFCKAKPEKTAPEEKMTTIGEAELKALDEAAQKAADDYNLKNAVIPTEAEKKQAELAAKNIGPVAKPDIEDLTGSVAKESMQPAVVNTQTAEPKTEKLYYPNGNLRKSIKATGGRTEEVKEYSKSGLLLSETSYNKDNILIEKYFGSGEIRRKIRKGYDDNAVMAFVSREDFYDNGSPRYEITRQPETLLFAEKIYTPKGDLKQETIQKSPLSLIIKDYDKDGKVLKETETFGNNQTVKEFEKNGNLKSFSLNGKTMPKEMAQDSEKVLHGNAKIYNKGALKAELKADKRQNTLVEYHPGKVIKTEIIFFNNGEISVKGYAKDGTLTKFAYLAPDGKLRIQKPEVRTIPNYRERRWIDYNNPNWVENQDKYSVKSINRLYLDTAAHILAELEMKVPEIMQKLYEVY